MTEVVVVAGPDDVADAAADRIVAILAEAVRANGTAHWATTGGSTVAGIYARLATSPRREAVPWPRIHAWWGDDRFVPRDHPMSNVKPFDDILLGWAAGEEGTAGTRRGVELDPAHLHPFPTGETIGAGRDAATCAASLVATLRADGPALVDGWPAFDLLMLGIGTDGHVLSVFPGSVAFGRPELALAVPAPTHIGPHVERVTLNPAVVTAARHVLVMATGSAKAEAIAAALGGASDATEVPARLADRPETTWILDEAAAANLPR